MLSFNDFPESYWQFKVNFYAKTPDARRNKFNFGSELAAREDDCFSKSSPKSVMGMS